MAKWTNRTLDQSQIKKLPSAEEMRRPVVVQPGESVVVPGLGEVFNRSTSAVMIETYPKRKKARPSRSQDGPVREAQ